MELIPEEGKNYSDVQTEQNITFGAVADIYMSKKKKKDEIG